jgi:methyl-accepting chemotaxis protein
MEINKSIQNLFNNLKISHKNNLVIGTIVISVAIAAVISYRGNQRLVDSASDEFAIVLDSTERVKVKTATEVIAKTLAIGIKESNITDPDSLYAFFSLYLDNLRFEEDESAYYFVYNKNTVAYTAENKKYEGTTLPDSKRYNQAKNGGGFTYGYYERPGHGKVKKLLYGTMIGDTDYWIGTGTYLDTFKKTEKDVNDVITDTLKATTIRLVLVGSLIFILITVIVLSIQRSIVKPINKIIKATDNMSLGMLDTIKHKTNDEFKLIINSLNNLVSNLRKTSDFAKDIGKGDFTTEFERASDKDVLGESLLDMRDSLVNAKEAEKKRAEEEDNRNWTMKGYSNIADILRKSQHDISILTNEVLTEIINYSGFNQGGIFIIDNEDKDLFNLTASYAYNRKKFLEKQIHKGEGLVGTCAIEQKTIYMKDIPDDYITISSGLGDATPGNLIIVPMMSDDRLLGVLELASFTEIEKHKRDFIEKSAEDIAATILSAQIAINTSKLLEKSKEQAEELASQEEEMRQNMEELQSTNEEWHRKEESMTREIAELKKELGRE